MTKATPASDAAKILAAMTTHGWNDPARLITTARQEIGLLIPSHEEHDAALALEVATWRDASEADIADALASAIWSDDSARRAYDAADAAHRQLALDIHAAANATMAAMANPSPAADAKARGLNAVVRASQRIAQLADAEADALGEAAWGTDAIFAADGAARADSISYLVRAAGALPAPMPPMHPADADPLMRLDHLSPRALGQATSQARSIARCIDDATPKHVSALEQHAYVGTADSPCEVCGYRPSENNERCMHAGWTPDQGDCSAALQQRLDDAPAATLPAPTLWTVSLRLAGDSSSVVAICATRAEAVLWAQATVAEICGGDEDDPDFAPTAGSAPDDSYNRYVCDATDAWAWTDDTQYATSVWVESCQLATPDADTQRLAAMVR